MENKLNIYKYLYKEEGREDKDTVEWAIEENLASIKDLIIRDETEEVYKIYKTSEDYSEDYPYANTNYNTHEVILGFLPQKPKYDIDGGSIINFNGIISGIKRAFEEIYSIKPSEVVYDSSSVDKFSRHIVISNVLFKNSREADNFTRKILKDYITGKDYQYIDNQVNKSTQNFRMPGATKEGRKKRVDTKHEWYDGLISYGNELIPILPEKCEKRTACEFTALNITEEQIKKISEAVGGDYEYNKKRDKNNMLVFDRIRKGYCDLCKREHDRSGLYICIYPNRILKYCFRNEDKKYEIIWEDKSIKINENKEILEEITNYIYRDNIGYAELFIKFNKNKIKVTDISTGSGYIWDEEKNLWSTIGFEKIKAMITPFLEKNASLYRIYLSEKYNKTSITDEKEKIDKEIKAITKILGKIRTNNIFHITNTVKVGLYDETFEKIKNTISYLLPLKNKKVVNLKTGETRERNQGDKFTFECPWEYKENISQKIKKYIMDLLNDNESLYEYFQTACGAFLTGEVEKALFVFYGETGNNGKSTFLNLLQKITNEYFTTMSKTVFVETNNPYKSENAHTSQLIPMIGKRLITISELKEGDELNMENLKKITGNDEFILRDCGEKKQITYRSVAKPIIITNILPKFNINDNAAINRIVCIPFNAEFKSEPLQGQKLADKQLIEALENELLSDLGSWMIQGAIKYYLKGLTPNDEIKKNKEMYIRKIDTMARFKEEMIEITNNKEDKISATELYEKYKEWCKNNKEKPLSNTMFGKQIKIEKIKNSISYYIGIRINN